MGYVLFDMFVTPLGERVNVLWIFGQEIIPRFNYGSHRLFRDNA
jgi:hypothetical protein